MSRLDSSAAAAAEARPDPIHQPFSWVPDPSDREGEFVALTLDVCNGLQTCLQLIHSTDMAIVAGDESPILDSVDRGNLFLLATAAARMLSVRAYQRVDWLNEQAQKVAGAGRQK